MANPGANVANYNRGADWNGQDGNVTTVQTSDLSTDEALRINDELIAGMKGRAGGRLAAWPLLIGFGTCSDALIAGAHALAEKHGTGWGMMHRASHPSRTTERSTQGVLLLCYDRPVGLGPGFTRSTAGDLPGASSAI